jgi:hypothetical protein
MSKRKRPTHATLYDFRDSDIMFRLADTNGSGIDSHELAESLGFDAEEGARPIGIRLAWMKRYGMVAFDDRERSWKLSKSGRRVVEAREKAPYLEVVDKMPDELMVDVMAHVTSRFGRGDTMLGHMLRREFMYGTKRR